MALELPRQNSLGCRANNQLRPTSSALRPEIFCASHQCPVSSMRRTTAPNRAAATWVCAAAQFRRAAGHVGALLWCGGKSCHSLQSILVDGRRTAGRNLPDVHSVSSNASLCSTWVAGGHVRKGGIRQSSPAQPDADRSSRRSQPYPFAAYEPLPKKDLISPPGSPLCIASRSRGGGSCRVHIDRIVCACPRWWV